MKLKKPSLLMMIGMTCLAISSTPSFLHLGTKLNPDALDFARGLFVGLAIGFNMLAVWMHGRNRRWTRERH